MSKPRKSWTARAAIALATLSFGVAGLLSGEPRLPATAAPGADEVRRARDSALELAVAISADGTPRPVRFAERDLDAAAALVNHGFDWLRVSPSIADGVLAARANLRLAEATWLNVEARAASDDAFPDIWLKAGAWELPPPVVRLVLRVGDIFLRWRGASLPPVDTMVRGLHVTDGAVGATLAVPQRLLRVAREVLGSTRPAVDPVLLGEAYRRLRDGQVARPSRSFADHVRRLFAERPARADAVERNRAAFVALAMFAVDPYVRRLAGSDAAIRLIDVLDPVELNLGGRPDLSKHFALSAAMAVAVDPRFTRAIGEWKELDDSLPDGSGFSFVDLTADRAGLHLGRAAVDPATAEAVAARLATATDDELFPAVALRLDEGMTNAEFRNRYGSLDARTYAEAVERVDAMLGGLSLYAPFIPFSP